MQERATNGRLGAERRQLVLDRLARDGKVVAAQLVEELGVSEDTVRRDLRDLAARGLVQRVHGGALPAAPSTGPFADRRTTAVAAKAELAFAALEAIVAARVVFLDGSTTNLEVARQLPPERNCTVLTNSPPISAALAGHPSAAVVVIGGRLDKRAQVTTGATAIDFIRTIRADVCVLGLCAVHPDVGVTTTDLEECQVKRAMVAASAEVVALATTDKLRAASPYVVGPVSDLAVLVTERDAPDALLAPYRAAGVTVVRA